MKYINLLKLTMELTRVLYRTILFKLGFVVKPYKVCWLITSRCNLTCHYCEIGRAPTRELKEEELDFDEVKNIVSQLKSLGVKFITFAGGEPLMYEDIFKVIKLCKEEGFIVGMVSNGTMITDSVAYELAMTGIDHVQLSLDYPGTLHDYIRDNQNCFAKVDSAIRSLLKHRPIFNYHLGVVTVVNGFNFDKLEEVFLYAKKYSLDSVGLQPIYQNQIRSKDITDKLTVPNEKIPDLEKEIKYLIRKYPGMMRTSTFFSRNIPKYLRDSVVKGATCFGGGLTINVAPNGTFGACYYLRSEESGSLRDKKLIDIINTPTYKRMLDRVRRGDCPSCWCAVVHEYNIFFRPIDIFRSLRLLRVAQDGR